MGSIVTYLSFDSWTTNHKLYPGYGSVNYQPFKVSISAGLTWKTQTIENEKYPGDKLFLLDTVMFSSSHPLFHSVAWVYWPTRKNSNPFGQY